jgi:hypothetical protein
MRGDFKGSPERLAVSVVALLLPIDRQTFITV